MMQQEKFFAFNEAISRLELQTVMFMLVDTKVVSEEVASLYLKGLAKLCRDMPEHLAPKELTEMKAQGYEDMAAEVTREKAPPKPDASE